MSTQVEEALQALGARLRGFRKDAGFASGRAFARATSWQESKVSRIENGKQRPSEDDIRVWCETTGQGDQLGDLVAIVRHVDELWLEWRRQLQTGVEKRQRQAIPVYAKTKVFRIWHPTLIWGTLQTADYAAEVFQQGVSYYEIPNDIDAAVAKRLERQQYLYQGERIFNVLLGEQALYTNFGGPEVMKGQLDRLLAVMRLPRLSLGIVPKSAPTLIWPGNAFSMFDSRLVLVETYSAEFSVSQPREIELYTKAFALLKQSAVYGTAVRELISTAIQHYDQIPND
ncbi:helix-turn-helix domain-containing protein [Streptomyces stelliscabiei]|uniref:helix-turn-helix domain-containing protein n=1 Tax=Streptomyces stelliscabiei TaxID=146820 RepID=UPI0029A32455|nr:helix-turn-helix transcriptional regulator [Streptomyces stelliscabiei]MDX2552538.1 helix-turn-helix transcriptional regulator [Streptomyces stelliscabiei]MDX2611933.1 helix-turn-helix transcriptional regulator [Streptomyces stelliscabiei]MDX2637280.1 helix-turn-helix transcriptional regulator [Streptomyces stelliscabiei]MDX2660699.1 helix-turn-helix transcriptional regulator [Streptomyces stelliscabiei]MDX2715013.1 helix-turn-helix transcriptional regulator [Streptomyces stelliscabiei]